jgi:hypothetical protein
MSVFCRVAADKDGRWWAVDGAGRRKIVAGVDHVRYQGFYSDALGFAPYGKNNAAKYPHRSDWELSAIDRIRKWGFTALGTGCDASLYGRGGLLYNVPLSFGHHLCRQKDPDLWIVPENRAPCSYIPNMFHPGFAAYADARAKELCAPRRGEKNLLGYFLDNELAWRGNGRRKDGLFKNVCSLPETHSAKKYLRNWAKRRNVNLNKVAEVDIEDFNRHLAEAYFGTAAAAIRRHDPNHLVLGARFAGAGNPPDAAWVAAGRHCDVISFNSYPHYDADKGIFRNFRKPDSQDIREAYGGRWRLAGGAPLMVTEWSFPALDAGLPCTRGAGHRMATQRERAEVSGRYVRVLAKMPYVIGYCYFMWTDQPPEGVSDSFPENSNYGLVSAKGEIYKELVNTLKQIQRSSK